MFKTNLLLYLLVSVLLISVIEAHRHRRWHHKKPKKPVGKEPCGKVSETTRCGPRHGRCAFGFCSYWWWCGPAGRHSLWELTNRRRWNARPDCKRGNTDTAKPKTETDKPKDEEKPNDNVKPTVDVVDPTADTVDPNEDVVDPIRRTKLSAQRRRLQRVTPAEARKPCGKISTSTRCGPSYGRCPWGFCSRWWWCGPGGKGSLWESTHRSDWDYRPECMKKSTDTTDAETEVEKPKDNDTKRPNVKPTVDVVDPTEDVVDPIRRRRATRK